MVPALQWMVLLTGDMWDDGIRPATLLYAPMYWYNSVLGWHFWVKAQSSCGQRLNHIESLSAPVLPFLLVSRSPVEWQISILTILPSWPPWLHQHVPLRFCVGLLLSHVIESFLASFISFVVQSSSPPKFSQLASSNASYSMCAEPITNLGVWRQVCHSKHLSYSNMEHHSDVSRSAYAGEFS